MGISLDTDPDWQGWIVLDGVCAVIFVTEVVVKSCVPCHTVLPLRTDPKFHTESCKLPRQGKTGKGNEVK